MTKYFVLFFAEFQTIISECPVCDANDYNPVCSSGKAFKSECHLLSLHCSKHVVLTSPLFGKCLQLHNPKPNVPSLHF
ncbi:hypothetical protein TcasGA2_TC034569 [Tribolium castaneum]|uniref:Kazal-like domain-containing protein n=1 Tax=Tribolium castaneum TaxID=7070 RepID=A0A139WMC7_TRICA|nr:hypothetical protein TcasGA2_TC034569 [Tribolium castaneum]